MTLRIIHSHKPTHGGRFLRLVHSSIRHTCALIRPIIVIFLLFGIAVCSENRPDRFGHSHPNPDSTLILGNAELPFQQLDREFGNLGLPNGCSSDFHYHISYDFTSVAPNLFGGNCRISGDSPIFCPVDWAHDSAPIPPLFEKDHPPLIG
jgi:hypothetical protein